jgi:hypothetical protein
MIFGSSHQFPVFAHCQPKRRICKSAQSYRDLPAGSTGSLDRASRLVMKPNGGMAQSGKLG